VAGGANGQQGNVTGFCPEDAWLFVERRNPEAGVHDVAGEHSLWETHHAVVELDEQLSRLIRLAVEQPLPVHPEPKNAVLNDHLNRLGRVGVAKNYAGVPWGCFRIEKRSARSLRESRGIDLGGEHREGRGGWQAQAGALFQGLQQPGAVRPGGGHPRGVQAAHGGGG
jgi:hypothetical protein